VKETRLLYNELAWLWPLWGDAGTEYADYSCEVVRLIRQHAGIPVTTLLDIGCGGGKNVLNLKQHFDVTGLDISPVMLAQAAELNPECRFIEGDMRTFRLGEMFDAILMDDAISHMNSLADFRATLRVAHEHLNPGGVLIVTPDVTSETFEQNKTTTTNVHHDGLDVTIIENVYDPDPSDEQYDATILYLIRQKGRLQIETDHWKLGLFPLQTWRDILRETGFYFHESPYMQYTIFTAGT
jgi:SAM-dependent methyltransferase